MYICKSNREPIKRKLIEIISENESITYADALPVVRRMFPKVSPNSLQQLLASLEREKKIRITNPHDSSRKQRYAVGKEQFNFPKQQWFSALLYQPTSSTN